MIELKLRGPCGLIDGEDPVFAAPDAWQPGIYLWSYLFNRSDRIHRIGVAHDSIARAQAEHVRAMLAGELPINLAAEREQGSLQRCYEPADGIERVLAHSGDLAAQMRALRVFYVPLVGADGLRVRISTAIERHITNLGGKAVAWLDGDNASDPAGADGDVIVRFYRPVHMASMPDELVV